MAVASACQQLMHSSAGPRACQLRISRESVTCSALYGAPAPKEQVAPIACPDEQHPNAVFGVTAWAVVTLEPLSRTASER